jgi:ABC-type uncharacterized transport system permease subunit
VTSALVDILFAVTALLYATAGGLFLAHVTGRREGTLLAAGLMTAATALHALHIVVFSCILHVCPVEGVQFPLSVAALFTSGAYLVGRRSGRVDAIGAVVAPLTTTMLLASRFARGAGLAVSPHVRSVLLPVHVMMNLLGIALFSFASAAAVLYLLQERRLKQKRARGTTSRLPPLEILDRAEHRFLIAGFPLLTLGIVSGSVWVSKPEVAQGADLLRNGLGYATWALFAGVLLLRAVMGWHGRRAAYGTLAGFGCALLVLAVYLLRPGAV